MTFLAFCLIFCLGCYLGWCLAFFLGGLVFVGGTIWVVWLVICLGEEMIGPGSCLVEEGERVLGKIGGTLRSISNFMGLVENIIPLKIL